MKQHSDLSARERTVASERAKILDQYYDLREDGYARLQVCNQVGVSSATISRWSRAYNKYGLVGLADKMSARRGGQSKMPEAQINFLHKATDTQVRPIFWPSIEMTIYRSVLL